MLKRRKRTIKKNNLSQKRQALLKSLDLDWAMKTVSFEFSSLKNNFKITDYEKDLVLKINNLNLILEELKYGYRNNAIQELIGRENLTYNQSIGVIRVIENDLFSYIKKNKASYEDNEVSGYEFAEQNEIFCIDGDVDYDTAKAEVFVTCEPLGTEDLVTSREPNVLKNKIVKVLSKLNDKFISELYKFHEERECIIINNLLEEYKKIIESDNYNYFSFEQFFDKSEFVSKLAVVSPPKKSNYLETYTKVQQLEQIKRNKPTIDDIFIPTLNKFLLHTPLKEKIQNEINQQYKLLLNKWENELKSKESEIAVIENYNKNIEKDYQQQQEKYENYLVMLENEKEEFLSLQNEKNREINNKILNFSNGEIKEVEEYFYNNIMNIPFPVLSYKDVEIKYQKDNRILIVNYVLPCLKEISNVKKVTLTISKKIFQTTKFKESELNSIYNDLIYRICIKALSEIFDCDEKYDLIDSVVFNGVVKSQLNSKFDAKMTCIMTIQVNKNEFKEIDILETNPKIVFRQLKGISAPELASLIPVQPILMLDKNDDRFIDAYEVIDNISDEYNIATMHWQDFENLVRELFEKEFCTDGSEVKITQSSRDGGVDAILFDPDPIRGGKIVIQAKRYTNIVGVSNVRDLYGTVLNEGANKGILVTTSDYGSDSYEFAKDKPLTLINGNNLLHLLQKQGKKVRINLQEAKEFFKSGEELKD